FWYLPAGGASRWWLAGCSYGLAAFRPSRRLAYGCRCHSRRAFYPLTLPLTVGPGSISVAITLGANTTRTHIDPWAFITANLIAITLVAVSIYVCYRFAGNRPGYSVATARVFFFGCPPSSCFASV